MIDGILDLLSGILVLGLVLAVAFGFILPLTNEDTMQFNSQYEDKAILSSITDYDDPSVYESLTRRLYSYEELVLLLAVQDSRMEAPKGVSLRNLVTEKNLSNTEYNYKNLNEIASTDKVLQAIQYYGENRMDMVELTYSNIPNIGIIRFTEEYGLEVDDMCAFLTRAKLATKGRLFDSEKRYFITYQYAIPDDSKYIKDNSAFKKLYFNEPIYMVQIKGNWQANSVEVDTYKDYLAYLNSVKDYTREK